jgi:23S rRNA pseudouridine2605 synthase
VFRLTIYEGKNRQIRRMCEAVGLEVARLRRVAVGPVKLGMLPPGKWREMTPRRCAAFAAPRRPRRRRPSVRRSRRAEGEGRPGPARSQTGPVRRPRRQCREKDRQARRWARRGRPSQALPVKPRGKRDRIRLRLLKERRDGC